MVTVTGFCLAVARLTSREQLSVTLPRVTGYLGTTEVNLDTVAGFTVYLQVVRLPGAGEGDVRDAEEADVDHLLLGAAAGGEVALEQAGVELQLAA